MPLITKKPAWQRHILPLTLIAIGAFLIIAQGLTNMGDYLRAQFTRVEYPARYDFTSYDHMLATSVKDGLIDYQSLAKGNSVDKAVSDLARVSPEHFSDPKQKLCFWINCYNLLVIKSVLNHYPVKHRNSLERDLGLRMFVIGGEAIATEQIRIDKINKLIPQCDPKAVFLLCGGSQGYPSLVNHAITTENLIADMESSTRKFVEDPNNVSFDKFTRTFFISQYFKWNEELIDLEFKSPFYLADQYLPQNQRVDLSDYHIKTRYMKQFNSALNDLAQVTPTTDSTKP